MTMPWWGWLGILLAIAVAAFVARRAMAQAAERAEAERLAQRAEATHESAITRHEGGA